MNCSPRPLLVLVPALAALSFAACGEKDEPEPGSAAPTIAQDGEPFDILGEWRGRLEQKGMKPFTVTATIRSLDEGRRNPVSYMGIDCAGSWTYEGTEGEAFRFREVIDRGAGGSCKGAGTVTLTPTADDELDYEFSGGGIESQGVLRRSG